MFLNCRNEVKKDKDILISSRPLESYGIGVRHVCQFVRTSIRTYENDLTDLNDFDQTSPVDLYRHHLG
jgi:hypothetical protein